MPSTPTLAASPDRPAPSSRPSELALGGLMLAAAAGSLFVAAGTALWPAGWVFVVAIAGGLAAHRAYVVRRNPGVVARRQEIRAGTQAWDKLWLAVFWPLMLATPGLAALDAVRFRWLPMTAWLWPAGLALLAAGMALSARAMAANPFFEGTVRIQEDQRVVEDGPYARIRHPGNLALALWALSIPFLLGSWWALLLAAVTACWVVLRTALEDRLLRRELPGYAGYARRVRWRLLPGAW